MTQVASCNANVLLVVLLIALTLQLLSRNKSQSILNAKIILILYKVSETDTEIVDMLE